MSKGLKAQERPSDIVSTALTVMKIDTSEVNEEFDGPDGESPAAQAMGRKGGKTPADRSNAEKRSEIAKKGRAETLGGNVDLTAIIFSTTNEVAKIIPR